MQNMKKLSACSTFSQLSEFWKHMPAIILFAGLLSFTRPADATTYYVANTGNNTTGTSYATAWRDSLLIQWNVLKAYDSIIIAGGSYAGLQVPSTVPAGIAIYQSKDAGYNGTVTFDGNLNGAGTGFDIEGPISIFGNGTMLGTSTKPETMTTSFLVQNYSSGGAYVGTLAGPAQATIKGVTFINDTWAVTMSSSVTNYAQVNVDHCLLRDNSIAAFLSSPSTHGLLNATNCWAFNSAQSTGTQNRVGFHGGNTRMSGCVFGPLLDNGVIVSNAFPGSTTTVTNCLFLDAEQNNFYFYTDNQEGALLSNCTLYCTPLNTLSAAHTNFYSNSNNKSLIGTTDNVVYGASIDVPAGASIGNNNYEYNVSGNATALAAIQKDPDFKNADVYTLPNNVTAQKLDNTNFAVKKKGVGSSLTSVGQLLAQPFGY